MTASFFITCVGVADGEELALGHDDDRVVHAEAADEVHVVLDEAEGVAALAVELEDGVADGAEERAVDAGADLVEEDDLRVDHHGAAELEELLLAAGEVAGELVGHVADLEELDHVVGLGADLGLARA